MKYSKRALNPMSREEIEDIQYESSWKMVHLGKMFGCDIWLDLSDVRHPKDRKRRYLMAKNLLDKSTGKPG